MRNRDLNLEEQRRIYKVLEKWANAGVMPAEISYFYNSQPYPDDELGANKIEESDYYGMAEETNLKLLEMWKDLAQQDWDVLSISGRWGYCYHSLARPEDKDFTKYQTTALHINVHVYDKSTLMSSKENLVTLIRPKWFEAIHDCLLLFHEIKEQKAELAQQQLTGKLMNWHTKCMIVETWLGDVLRKEANKKTYEPVTGKANTRAFLKVREILKENAITESWHIEKSKRKDFMIYIWAWWLSNKGNYRNQFTDKEWAYVSKSLYGSNKSREMVRKGEVKALEGLTPKIIETMFKQHREDFKP